MSHKHIKKLISESNDSNPIANGRPSLVSLTGKADNIIFSDIVATQVTDTPNAAVYGLSVYNTGKKDGDTVKLDIYHDSGTSTGRMTLTRGYALDEADTAKAYKAGDLFKLDAKGLFFEVAEDITLSTLNGDTTYDKVVTGVSEAKIRLVTDAMPYDNPDHADMSEVDFTLRKWDLNVNSRKLRVAISNELIEDLQTSDLDSDALVDDVIASSIAMDINKDIIQKLINVSNRFEDEHFVKDGIGDLSTGATITEKSRNLYALVCLAASRVYEKTTYSATYVICSPMVYSILSGSGWIRPTEDAEYDPEKNATLSGVMNNGMLVYVDRFPLFEYFVVGCKHEREGLESIGSLYYSPYKENDNAGFISIISSPDDLHPRIGVMVRYALSVNTLYTSLSVEERESTRADDWNKLMGKSEASQFVRVKF